MRWHLADWGDGLEAHATSARDQLHLRDGF